MSRRASTPRQRRKTDLRYVEEQDSDQAPELDTRLIWALLFFCLAIFAKVPQLDLMATARYYTPELGFIHSQDPWVLWSYNWTPWIGRALILVLVLLWAFNGLIAKALRRAGQETQARLCEGLGRRVAILTVVSALLGPGLLIEGFFKNVAGRPRPVQVIELGGTVPYHGPFQWGDKPHQHKSFVSSHAAAGFALMGLGLACGPVWRRRWLHIGIVSGAVIGAGRMMQGGHFLSDIIFSFFSVWICCELVLAWDRRRQASSKRQ